MIKTNKAKTNKARTNKARTITIDFKSNGFGQLNIELDKIEKRCTDLETIIESLFKQYKKLENFTASNRE